MATIETYTAEHLVPPLASAQKARVTSGTAKPSTLHGKGRTVETAFGYRVIGDGFVIEMGSVDEAAQLHTIYHDLASVLGGRGVRRETQRRQGALAGGVAGSGGVVYTQ